jgi:hypothetical protein
MSTKKTTTNKAAPQTKQPDPRTCIHMDKYGASTYTSYGIPQPDNGDVYQVCQYCGDARTLPDTRNVKPKKETPQYTPPPIDGEVVSLWADAGIGLTDKEKRRIERSRTRKANKAQRMQ